MNTDDKDPDPLDKALKAYPIVTLRNHLGKFEFLFTENKNPSVYVEVEDEDFRLDLIDDEWVVANEANTSKSTLAVVNVVKDSWEKHLDENPEVLRNGWEVILYNRVIISKRKVYNAERSLEANKKQLEQATNAYIASFGNKPEQE